jgi:rare lipoprotein A
VIRLPSFVDGPAVLEVDPAGYANPTLVAAARNPTGTGSPTPHLTKGDATVASRRYTPRHGAWVNKNKRPRSRRPGTQLLPLAAALIVASMLVGSAGVAIGLSPVSKGYDANSTYDPADVPPPDPFAQAGSSRNNAVAPLTAVPLTGSPAALEPAVVSSGTCEAVYYGKGQRTASGEAFDPTALTAAHRSLPFGTMVRVINQATGASVVVRINDRATMEAGRCLDLSIGAFSVIAKPSQGVADVRYEVLAPAAG